MRDARCEMRDLRGDLHTSIVLKLTLSFNLHTTHHPYNLSISPSHHQPPQPISQTPLTPILSSRTTAPSAHSTHLHIRPDPSSSLPFAPVTRAKFRKDHKQANDNAALDRLLADEFQSGRESVSLGGEEGVLGGRRSVDQGGRPVGLGLGRQGSAGRGSLEGGAVGEAAGRRGTGLARNLSEKLTGVRSGGGTTGGAGVGPHSGSGANGGGGGSDRPSAASGLMKRRLGSGRRKPLGSGSGQGNGAHSDEEVEQLSSRALGVFIDQEGRLHDKEYDPFEKVRSLSRRKVERRRVFGAAREDESEVGSEGSGSAVSGFGGGGGGFEARYAGAYGRNTMKSPTFTSPGAESSAAGGRTRSGTLWSEYDSGISATSPRPFGTVDPEIAGGPLSPLYAGKDQQGEDNVGVGNAQHTLSPTSSRPSSSQRGGRREGPMASSVKTSNTISLARLEERPRSLLFPATPAQLAAQKIKERNASSHGHHHHHHHDGRTSKAGGRRHHDVLEEEDDEVAAALRPPVAPFNPMYSTDRRAGSPSSSIKAGKGKARDSGEYSRMYNNGSGQYGRRQSTHSHPGQAHSIHLQGDGHAAKSVSGLQHAGSSVFSGADMGYLPSRWARGEREFRAGEEELDKYRPMEFRGTREDHKEPEWK